MNILILTTHFNTGGITSYILTLTKGLQEKGHKVYVTTSGGNLVEELLTTGAEHREVNIRTKSELNPKIYFALISLCQLIKEKNIDIVHTHTRITQVMGTLLSKITKKSHVTTCHGFFKRRLARRIFPCWGDCAIAISEAVQNHLINDFGVDTKKVFLIHSGLDLTKFEPVSEEVKKQKRREFNLNDGPVIGIIARLSDIKGHDILILAMKRVVEKIPNANLLIVGEGKFEDYLKKMVHDFHLKNNVRFYPVVNRTAEILSLLDIFVMPSLQEGLGLAVMEAQAMGLPVIASRVGGIPRLIKDGETGLLVVPQDVIGLSEAILFFLNDKTKAQQIGENARKFIHNEFSADKMVEKTLQVYQSLVNKR